MPASLAGVPFAVNPKGVSWDYTVRIATTKTIGGKVIQLLGWNMGDLVIRGQYGRDGVARQKAFFAHVKAIAEAQAPTIGSLPPEPVRFLWPEKGWDFWVYVKGLMQTGASVSIDRTNAKHSPDYTLTLFVYEDNGDIVKAVEGSATVKYLQRITAGMGWSQTEWSGPMNIEQIQANLAGSTILQYLTTPIPMPEFEAQLAGTTFGDPAAPPAPVLPPAIGVT